MKVRTDFGSSSGWFAALPGHATAPLSQAVKLKDSLTQWRATAYVVTNGPHLGVGQGDIRTEKPLMVRLQAPRFFTERDEVTLSGIVVSRLPKARRRRGVDLGSGPQAADRRQQDGACRAGCGRALRRALPGRRHRRTHGARGREGRGLERRDGVEAALHHSRLGAARGVRRPAERTSSPSTSSCPRSATRRRRGSS